MRARDMSSVRESEFTWTGKRSEDSSLSRPFLPFRSFGLEYPTVFSVDFKNHDFIL